MTAKEAIQTIEAAKAEVEWNYSLNYAAAFEVAIEVLEKQIPKRAISTYIGNYKCPTCETSMAELNKLHRKVTAWQGIFSCIPHA